jgi:hypothetical protein
MRLFYTHTAMSSHQAHNTHRRAAVAAAAQLTCDVAQVRCLRMHAGQQHGASCAHRPSRVTREHDGGAAAGVGRDTRFVCAHHTQPQQTAGARPAPTTISSTRGASSDAHTLPPAAHTSTHQHTLAHTSTHQHTPPPLGTPAHTRCRHTHAHTSNVPSRKKMSLRGNVKQLLYTTCGCRVQRGIRGGGTHEPAAATRQQLRPPARRAQSAVL